MTRRLPAYYVEPSDTLGDVVTTLPDGTVGWAGATGGGSGLDLATIAFDTIDVATYSGQSDAGARLSLADVSHVGSDEATHPSVLRLPDTRLVMAFTPYPNGDAAAEDPNIAVSNDGTTWVTPSGLTNPLDDQGGTTYNSDTELVLFPDGVTIGCVWRTVTSTQEILYLRTTTDLVTWTAKAAILTVTKTAENILAPAIVHDGTQWVLWTIDAVPAPNVMRRRTAASLTGPWSAATACTITGLPAGRDPWHSSVVKLGSQYVCLLNDTDSGAHGVNGDLYLMRSADQLAWTTSGEPVVSKALAGEYDGLYRGCLVPTFEAGRLELDMWYGGVMRGGGATTAWHIYRRRLSQTGSAGSAGITVQDENGTIATGVTQIDFQGANVTAAAGTGEVVVTVTGASGGSSGELLLQDGVSSPPVPLETEDGTDWLYQG